MPLFDSQFGERLESRWYHDTPTGSPSPPQRRGSGNGVVPGFFDRAKAPGDTSLFGSTARGEAGPDSDVDLLAAFDETRRISLLDIVGMKLDLSDMLGCMVDLIEEGTLKPSVQKSVETEVIRAF